MKNFRKGLVYLLCSLRLEGQRLFQGLRQLHLPRCSFQLLWCRHLDRHERGRLVGVRGAHGRTCGSSTGSAGRTLRWWQRLGWKVFEILKLKVVFKISFKKIVNLNSYLPQCSLGVILCPPMTGRPDSPTLVMLPGVKPGGDESSGLGPEAGALVGVACKNSFVINSHFRRPQSPLSCSAQKNYTEKH